MNMKKKNLSKITAILIFILIAITAAFCTVYLFSGKKAGAEEPFVPEMTLDDQSYTIKDGCVFIPAGRPRVPQLICDDADAVYQAFFADGETESFAKIVCGEDIYEIKFLKDPALGFELQYDDYYYFVPSFEVQGEVTYTSSDASIAQVSDDGEVHIINVSDKGVVITADDGHNIEELVITRTVKTPISVYMLTGQSNASYYYASVEEATVIKKGTGYIYNAAISEYTIECLTDDKGNMRYGNIEASLAKRLYDELGEKVLIINTGISSMKIAGFLPGSDGYDTVLSSWNVMNSIMRTDWFAERFEPRVRSYIWIQGESDEWLPPEEYMESFLTIHSALCGTDFGFEYAFISNVASRFFRPNDAQERLAQAYEDIYMASRFAGTFTTQDGTLREDNLHYTQKGDNILGDDIGETIAVVYKGNGGTLLEGEKDR